MPRIISIEFHNVGIIKDGVYKVGKHISYEGPNDLGKTTAINASLECFGVKTNATLLRTGEKEGYACVVFDDPNELQFRLKLKPGKKELEVRDKYGPKNKTFLSEINDALKVDPARFKDANKKGERKDLLLDIVPFVLTEDQIKQLGIDAANLADSNNHLDYLNELYDQTYADRRDANVAAKEKSNAITQLGAALPSETSEEIRASINKESTREESLRHQLGIELKKLDDEKAAEKTKVNAAAKTQHDEVQKTFDEKLAELTSWKEAQFMVIDNTEKVELDKVTAKYDAKRDAVNASHAGELQTVSNTLGSHRAKLEEVNRNEQLISLKNKYSDELLELRAKSEQKDKFLTLIDTVKDEMLKSIPIPGLTVKGDDVYYNGMIWADVNEAKQWEIGVDLALLRKGSVVCVRNLEALDDANLQRLIDIVDSKGAQLIGARVRPYSEEEAEEGEGLRIVTDAGSVLASREEEVAA